MNALKLKDGRQLAFEQYGAENGIPVIHQHGFGDSRLARHPDNNLTIDAGIRLITVDRPGYGESFLDARAASIRPARRCFGVQRRQY